MASKRDFNLNLEEKVINEVLATYRRLYKELNKNTKNGDEIVCFQIIGDREIAV